MNPRETPWRMGGPGSEGYVNHQGDQRMGNRFSKPGFGERGGEGKREPTEVWMAVLQIWTTAASERLLRWGRHHGQGKGQQDNDNWLEIIGKTQWNCSIGYWAGCTRTESPSWALVLRFIFIYLLSDINVNNKPSKWASEGNILT